MGRRRRSTSVRELASVSDQGASKNAAACKHSWTVTAVPELVPTSESRRVSPSHNATWPKRLQLAALTVIKIKMPWHEPLMYLTSVTQLDLTGASRMNETNKKK